MVRKSVTKKHKRYSSSVAARQLVYQLFSNSPAISNMQIRREVLGKYGESPPNVTIDNWRSRYRIGRLHADGSVSSTSSINPDTSHRWQHTTGNDISEMLAIIYGIVNQLCEIEHKLTIIKNLKDQGT